MKQLFSFIFILTFLIGVCILPASAEGTGSLSIASVSGEKGDTVTLTVNLTSNPGLISMKFTVSWDSDLELTGVSDRGTIGGWTSPAPTISSPYTIRWADSLATTDSTSTGALVNLTFKIKDTATPGNKTVSINFSESRDAKGGTNTFNSPSATVTVACAHQYDNDCDDTCNVCGGTRTVQHAWVVKSETPAPDCNTPGSVTYECSKCHITKSENTQPGHKYEDAKDANGHYQKCSVCGAETTHEAHTYSTEWKHDDKGHWQICTECEYEDKDHKAAHTPGAEATEFTDQVCTTCKRVLKGATHQCTEFEEEWFRDDRGHRHKCTECGKYSEFEKHDYENECDADCSICGYTRIPEHLYTEKWSADVNGHWHACELCGEGLEIEPHVPGPEATLTTPQICLVCNYEIAPSLGHTHKYDGQWKHDADGHWKVCSCGKESDEEAHRWDAGVVTREPTSAVVGRKTFTCQDCGYQKIESIDTVPSGNGPIPDNTPKKPGFPWWLIIILVAIPVVAGCAYVLVGVVGSKKQEGRFTEQ